MKKTQKKNKNFNKNQKSFYFEDYIETNLKQKNISKSLISEDRVYLLFFFIFLFNNNIFNKDYCYFNKRTSITFSKKK